MKKIIKIYQKKIADDVADSFFYEGDIAGIEKPNGTFLKLIATGQIRIYHKKRGLVYDGKERNGGIKGGLNCDADLKKIGNNSTDTYHWEDNNWFEVIYRAKGENFFDSDMCVVAYDYDEAISLLKSYYDDDRY